MATMRLSHASPPTPPSSSLPPLARLASYPTSQIASALHNLRALYFSPLPPVLPVKKTLPKHVIHDTSVPDSGYASAEEDDEDEEVSTEGEDESFDIDVLRSDVFEREFAVRWLIGFTGRSDPWVTASDDEDARVQLVDAAASLLASFAGEDEEEELTRRFSFAMHGGEHVVEVELNDAPLLSEDHTSVGLQSWASSILLAERMCADPHALGLLDAGGKNDGAPRILELGAGTGLLSIAAAKIFESVGRESTIIATDYHPSVLTNLEANVDTNFGSTPRPSADKPVQVTQLDWQDPVYDPPLHEPFDFILAADVVYQPEHARWIKNCVEKLLARPSGRSPGGIFWLIVAVRSTGRHEGLANTVEDIFPPDASIRASITGSLDSFSLAVLTAETMGRHDGVGRADETAYKLFKIGWVRCC